MVASTKRLRRADATVHYFEADGYYARGDPMHRQASRWRGEAARALGLHGPVKAKRFAQVLAGFVPGTGQRLGRLREGEHQHQPGLDVTFSAPKSVSVEALVYAPARTRARLLNAHDGAVGEALEVLEGELLQTRGYDRETGRRPRVRAHGMVAATFRHIVSRNLDPQVHTHAVVANMTRDAQKRFRSAEFTRIERSRKLLGAAYRAALQRRVEAMGYATVPTVVGAMPGFELAGYARGLLGAFSTRRRELLAYLSARGWRYSAAAAQQATLYTRRAKAAEPDREALGALWRARAAELGAGRDARCVRGRGERAPGPRPPLSTHALVWRAMAHLEERHSVFGADALRAFALAHGAGAHGLEAIDAEVAALCRDGHLVEAAARRADRAFATARTLAAERRVLRTLREGHGAGAALADEAAVGARLGAGALNAGQREAVRVALLSGDRLVGVQGHAGTGKTTMLRELCALADALVVGLAPSASAARVLERETGIAASTLQGFLTRYRDVGDGLATPRALGQAREALGGALVVLDESSMVSTVQMAALLRIADALGVARVVLAGDRRQLRAVEAGAPFALLQRAGMATAHMHEVLRQRDPALKSAVAHLIAERPGLALGALGGGVIELSGDEDEPEDPPLAAARLWLDLDAPAREGAALLAPTHAQRARINAAVREGLADEGVLHGPVLTIERYVNLRLTRAQKADVAQYREGDVAVFHARVPPLRLRAGDACRVLGAQGPQVLLDHPDGKPRHIAPAGHIRYRLELFETEPMALRAGDRVRWTRNAPDHGLVNGERARIAAIGAKRVRFVSEHGRDYALARSDAQLHHLDYAYSSTVHAAQGMTCDAVIAVLDADQGPVTDQARFYVELTRARDNVVLLTTDREALAEALETQSAEELSALEAIGAQFAAPPVPAPGALRDKAAHWPALAQWRAFAETAHARGEDPFEAEGHEEALAPVLALADGDGPPEGLPEALAGVLAEHGAREAAARGRVEDVLGALDACLGTRDARCEAAAAAGRAVTTLAGHAAWGRRVESALGRARALRPEDAARVEGAPERLAGSVAALERARGLDTRAAALLDDWNGLRQGACARRRPFAHQRGYPALHRRMEALSREAAHPGEVPPALARALAEHAALGAGREAVRQALRTLREAAGARDALVDEAHAGNEAVAQRPRYAAWGAGARAACAAARQVWDDAQRQDARWRGPGAALERLGLRLRAIERAIDFDARAAALVSHWRAHEARPGPAISFYRKGYADLAARMLRLADEAARPAEIPPALAGALARHRELSAERDAVVRADRAVRACIERRTALLDEAVKERRALTELDGHARWREDARQAMERWEYVLAEPRHRAHWPALPGGGREEMAAASDALRDRLRCDERAEALRRDWSDHARRAREEGHDPFEGKAGAGLGARLLDFAGASDHPGETPQWLSDARARHRAFAADRDTVKRACEALRTCTLRRIELLSLVGFAGFVFTQFKGYPRWREAAEAARRQAEAVVGAERRYRPHVEAVGETWETFANVAQALGRGLDYDVRARETALRCARFERRARDSGLHPCCQDGFAALYRDTRQLVGEHVFWHEVPPECGTFLDQPIRLIAATRHGLGLSRSERGRLASETPTQAPALWEHARYAPWREHAERERAHARRALDQFGRFSAFLDSPEEERALFTRVTKTVDAWLAFDARGKALLERRRRHVPREDRAAAPSAFYAPWYAEHIAEAKELAEDAADSAEMPAVLTRDLDAHVESVQAQERAKACARALEQRARERRARLKSAAASRQALTEREDHAALSKGAHAACVDARAMIDDAATYGPHLEALEGARQGFVRSAEALERGLGLDARSRPVAEAWQAHHRAASTAGVHPMDHPGYTDLVRDMTALDAEATRAGEAHSPLAGLLARHRGYETDRAAVRRALKTILPCAGEREGLLDEAHAARQVLTALRAYEPWASSAREACSLWAPLRADEERYRTHAKGLGGSWEDLSGAAAALENELGLDGRSRPFAEAWQAHHQAAAADETHPLDHPGYEAVVKDMTALDAEATRAGERRSPVGGLLARHREYETDRAAVKSALDSIMPCAGERNTLLDDAHTARQALTELRAYGTWAAGAHEACTAWAPLRGDEKRYRLHAKGLGGSWETLAGAAAVLERGLGLDERSAPLGEAWQAHHQAASAAGVHPMDHPGYADLVEDMTALDAEATRAGEALSPLAGPLARHRGYETDRAAVGRVLATIMPCAGERNTLLDDAHTARQALTELRAYGTWAAGAHEACTAWAPLRGDEKRYRLHAKGLGGSWETLAGAAAVLERGLGLDERSAPLGEAWQAHHQAASAAGVHPMDHPGYADLVEDMTALDAEATRAGETRSPLAGPLARHREYREERESVTRAVAEVDALARQRNTLLDETVAANRAIWKHPEYPEWGRRADAARAQARPLLDDAVRYRPHVEAGGGDWTRFATDTATLDAARVCDRRAWALVKRLHSYSVVERGDGRCFLPGHEAVVARIERHCRKARHPGEVTPSLRSELKLHERFVEMRAYVTGTPGELEARIEERRRLGPKADAEGPAPVEHATHGDWAQRSRKTRARWHLVRDEARYRRHVEATPQGDAEFRRTCAARAEALEGQLAFDHQARETLERWQAHREAADRARRHPFHQEGYEDVYARIGALDQAAPTPGEVPRALRDVLARHPGLVADRDTAVGAERALDGHIEVRHALLGYAEREGVDAARVSGYRLWQEGVLLTLLNTRAILQDPTRYGPHGVALRNGMDGLRRQTKALERALEVDDHAERLYRDWVQERDTHDVAQRKGTDPSRRQTTALERAFGVDRHGRRVYRDSVQGRGGSPPAPDRAAVGREAVDRLEQEVASLRARDLRPGELHPGVEAALERHRERLENKRAPERTRDSGMGYGM